MAGFRAFIWKRKGLFGYESPGKEFYENMSITDDAMMELGVPRGGMGPCGARMFMEAVRMLDTEPAAVSDPKFELLETERRHYERNGCE